MNQRNVESPNPRPAARETLTGGTTDPGWVVQSAARDTSLHAT
jgi:hypothetical protein